MKKLAIIGITPFEKPDVPLVLELHHAGAFPVLNLGFNKIAAEQALEQLVKNGLNDFGVCFASADLATIDLPEQVSIIIAPYGLSIKQKTDVKFIYQVNDLESAKLAKAASAYGIIIRGNEGAGNVGYESSFVLFQRVIQEIKDIPIWVQGGAGIHTTAALFAQGAAGVVLDSQLALFPECSAPKAFKELCTKLNGTETKLIANCRVLVRPNSPVLPHDTTYDHLKSYFTDLDPEKSYIPMGQDIALSSDLVRL